MEKTVYKVIYIFTKDRASEMKIFLQVILYLYM